MFELLREICDTPGVAGFEDPIREVVVRELNKSCDDVRVDTLGNATGLKRARKAPPGQTPLRVMVAAHMDEIGFLVRHIDADGFVTFMPMGGFDPRVLVAERVVIHGRREVRGVIAPQPGWLLSDEERRKVLEIKQLYVDTGLTKAELEPLVRVGDPISFAQRFELLNGKTVVGRNFDDRIGVYALLETMRRLGDCAVDVYAVATVQEELGVRGATVAAYAIEPAVGIAIDGSLASDVPFAREEEKNCRLGAGTGIYIVDSRTVSDRPLVAELIGLAEAHGIPYQRNLGGGTDASVIQRTRSGVRACTIGAPTRYMHSTAQLCNVDDIEATIRLLVVYLQNARAGAIG